MVTLGERVGRSVAGGDIVLVGWKDVGWERRDEVEEALIYVNIGGRFLSDVVHIVVAVRTSDLEWECVLDDPSTIWHAKITQYSLSSSASSPSPSTSPSSSPTPSPHAARAPSPSASPSPSPSPPPPTRYLG